MGWGFIGPRWWRNYLHTHSFFEVCYAFQGQGLFRFAGVDYAVQAGDVFIAKPGVAHEIISSEEDPLGIYFWSYTLYERADAYNAPASGVDELLRAYLASPSVVSARTTAMLRTLELLTEEGTRREPGYLQVVEGLVIKLLLDTARSVVDTSDLCEPLPTPVRSPEEAVTQTIKRYLYDNYARPITMRDLAAQVHLSERHTARLFRKVTGDSIMDYLTRLRLEMAAQLLLDRQARMPIKEIAQACGYPDVRYFTTLFRQRTGLTPALFRQQGGTRFFASSPSLS
ncbi:AraC family transcriptional regulator [Ktedonobacter sp. SOSP1-52]|uniref:AraC family transcriptional regulator n=1 Tax=Ktedonobacter sp. SOSP1-52 TaxID=2778366 RepID=UPI001916B1FE|nr:AraC family transcriptional regulator [Ktedonobacter sp. SOSP1-52]